MGDACVGYGSQGSVRPDLYDDITKTSIEVKNYNIETSSGRNKLVRNVSRQYWQRLRNLPDGTHQIVLIDARGQNYEFDYLSEIKQAISTQTNNNMTVWFKLY